MLSGQTSQAVEALTRAVKLDGDNVDAYLRLGTLFRESGQPGRAVRIHKSLLMRPNLPEQLVINAVFELALDYRGAGDLDKAADVLQKVITLDSNHAVAFRELKSIYEKAGRWENALNTGKRLLRLTRSKDQSILSPLHLAWGRDLLVEGQTEAALQAFRQAIKLNPKNAVAHLALGDALFDSGQSKAAITAWEQLIKESPAHFPYALERLERAYFAAGHYDDLRKVYLQYLERYPDDPTVRLALAEFYLRRGRIDEAGKELERIGEDSLGSVKACLHLLRIDKEGEESRWEGHLEAALETLSALSRTFQCRACGESKREYFWRCSECDELDSAVRAFPPIS
jgi:lipopolysaccharide biosynthesis regulator YciM